MEREGKRFTFQWEGKLNFPQTFLSGVWKDKECNQSPASQPWHPNTATTVPLTISMEASLPQSIKLNFTMASPQTPTIIINFTSIHQHPATITAISIIITSSNQQFQAPKPPSLSPCSVQPWHQLNPSCHAEPSTTPLLRRSINSTAGESSTKLPEPVLLVSAAPPSCNADNPSLFYSATNGVNPALRLNQAAPASIPLVMAINPAPLSMPSHQTITIVQRRRYSSCRTSCSNQLIPGRPSIITPCSARSCQPILTTAAAYRSYKENDQSHETVLGNGN